MCFKVDFLFVKFLSILFGWVPGSGYVAKLEESTSTHRNEEKGQIRNTNIFIFVYFVLTESNISKCMRNLQYSCV